MDISEAIKKRYSCKSFDEKKSLDPSLLEEIICAGSFSPIGRGVSENFHITSITDKETLRTIDKISEDIFGPTVPHALYGAPALIVISAKLQDEHALVTFACTSGCIAENIMLKATAEGVDSVCLTGVIRAIRRLNGDCSIVPEEYTPLLAVALGYGKNPVNQTENKGKVFPRKNC